MIRFEFLKPYVNYDMLGLIPHFFDADDPRPAREQINANYQHGGGWSPLKGWRLSDNDVIRYPGDEPLEPLAKAMLRDELIVFYPHAWVAIIQPDRSFEVARLD